MTLTISPDVMRQLDGLSRQRSNFQCLQALLFDYSVIAGAIWLSLGVSFWFYPLSLLLIGSTQRAFTNLLHESTHTTLAANRWLNYLGGSLLSGHLIFHMFVPYKHSHIACHHPHLGHAERDPDYRFHIECGLYRHSGSMREFIGRNVLLAILGFRSWSYLKYVVRDRILFRSEKQFISAPLSFQAERLCLAGLWALILGSCAWMGWMEYLVLFWIIPLFTFAIAIGWLIELSEHYPLPESEKSPLLLTRNRHGWWLERFLMGRHNDNYHLVHHLRPGVPYYSMKAAHEILLKDPAYRTWDAMWGGMFTRSRAGEETLLSYIRKYRQWQRLSPGRRSESFATLQLAQRVPHLPATPAAAQPAPVLSLSLR